MFVTSQALLKCSITAQMPDANLFLEFQPPTHSDFQIFRFSDFYHFTFFFSNCTSQTCIFIFSCSAGGSFYWFIPIVCRRQMKKSKSLFCLVLRAFFTTSFFYVLNCRLNLLAVLSSFQLHKRFLSGPGPNRNKLLLLRLDRCLSG